MPEEENISKIRIIPLLLQKLFSEMEMSITNTQSTKEFTEEGNNKNFQKGFGWKHNEIIDQQDVSEFHRVLLDKLEESLANLNCVKDFKELNTV